MNPVVRQVALSDHLKAISTFFSPENWREGGMETFFKRTLFVADPNARAKASELLQLPCINNLAKELTSRKTSFEEFYLELLPDEMVTFALAFKRYPKLPGWSSSAPAPPRSPANNGDAFDPTKLPQYHVLEARWRLDFANRKLPFYSKVNDSFSEMSVSRLRMLVRINGNGCKFLTNLGLMFLSCLARCRQPKLTAIQI